MTIEQKAQKYLLDNDCGDLILNDTVHTKLKDHIYASDIMTKFYQFMCDSQKKVVCERKFDDLVSELCGELKYYKCSKCGEKQT